jgi:hypothetical protein
MPVPLHYISLARRSQNSEARRQKMESLRYSTRLLPLTLPLSLERGRVRNDHNRRRFISSNFTLPNGRLEAVGWGPDQGRRMIETGGVAALRRGFQSSENADMGLKMPFPNNH